MRFILILLLFPISFITSAQENSKVDDAAVIILDKMADVIGDLGSCSFNLETSKDILNDHYEYEKRFGTHEVHMVGPDKMTVHSRGDQGEKGYWYDGEFLSYYNFDENNYVTLPAPDNIITMMDSLHMKFDMKFPAADFFYPSFTDDLLDEFESIQYLGKRTVDGQECFYIMARNDQVLLQLWVTNDAFYLPKKYHINWKKENNKQFEGTFSNWKLNPELPDAIFDFKPPQSARLISILAKS